MRSIYDNRRGTVSPALMIGAFIVISALLIWVALGVRQSQLPEADLELKAATGDCNTVPYITVSAKDAINPGTAVTSLTLTHTANGVPSGTLTSGSSGTNFAPGDSVDLLVGKTNYLDVVVSDINIKCGNNAVNVDLYATDDGTLKIFNEDGNAVTDAVDGAVNQSNSATTINMEVKLTSVSDQSLGDMIIIVEAKNTTEIDDILMSDGSHTSVASISVPDFYTLESGATGAITKAFEVNGANNYLSDGKSDTYTLSIDPESGITIGALTNPVYVSVYTKQWFVDVDGSFVYGYENTDGTTKYEDTFDYDFNIV
ncbi:hypothetical protein CL617_00600 [archaeon]|nr:hypothetical protein [archaeon]|tara:strand:+ start:1646 stop:2587 length:942 start_codon:yes stop_codon:yes gene_type:complete